MLSSLQFFLSFLLFFLFFTPSEFSSLLSFLHFPLRSFARLLSPLFSNNVSSIFSFLIPHFLLNFTLIVFFLSPSYLPIRHVNQLYHPCYQLFFHTFSFLLNYSLSFSFDHIKNIIIFGRCLIPKNCWCLTNYYFAFSIITLSLVFELVEFTVFPFYSLKVIDALSFFIQSLRYTFLILFF